MNYMSMGRNPTGNWEYSFGNSTPIRWLESESVLKKKRELCCDECSPLDKNTFFSISAPIGAIATIKTTTSISKMSQRNAIYKDSC
mmetsp:Transcript_4614/g.7039  ORF Transcript_4614/g.7039 Transcript_4614/m.7039 type:complete len:86 (-) Transcript_4614:629-886(-)